MIKISVLLVPNHKLYPHSLFLCFSFPCSLSQEQLMSTGGVWVSCDLFEKLPRGEGQGISSMTTAEVKGQKYLCWKCNG